MKPEDNFNWAPAGLHICGENSDPPMYCLVWDEFYEKMDCVKSLGYPITGALWESVIRAFIEELTPQHESALEYDSEYSCFVVRSSNLDALKRVLHFIRMVDKDAVDALIEKGYRIDHLAGMAQY